MGERICAVAAKLVNRNKTIFFMYRLDFDANYGLCVGDARKLSQEL